MTHVPPDTKAVVVGGTHGMGLAIIEALVVGGAEVLLTGRDERNIEQVAGRFDAAQVHAVRSDITDLGDIDALGGTVADTLGTIDALFVNAGVALLEPFDEVTEASYDRTFDVNAKGAFFTMQRLAPLVRDGGSIVVTTVTGGGQGGTPTMSVYLGAKAALLAFAQTLAAELLPRRIRVNAVAPGFIDTPTMGVTGASAEQRATLSAVGDEITPMKRHGTAAEVADAALFLAFGATFTTGAQLAVDGGLSTPVDAPHDAW